MKHSEGTSFAQADGSWLRVQVDVDEDDLARVITEWLDHDSLEAMRTFAATSLPTELRWRVLAWTAQQMVLRREISEFQGRAVKPEARGNELRERVQRSLSEKEALRTEVMGLEGRAGV